MSEVPSMVSEEVDKPEESETTAHYRGVISHIYGLMKERQIYGVRAFTGKGIFELAAGDPEAEARLGEEFIQKTAEFSSAYLVFEGAHPDHQTVLFKIKIDRPDTRHSGENELAFYKDLMPEIQASMPAEVSNVRPPDLIEGGHSDRGFSYVITEFADGEQLGKRFFEADSPLTSEEFRQLAIFIKHFQEACTPERARELSSDIDFNDIGATSTYENHVARMKSYGENREEALGSEDFARMQTLLAEKEEFLRGSPRVFCNQDINPANLIRSEDTLYIIDWERLKLVPSSAAAYNHIIESHWKFPDVQKQMIQTVLELNRDIPDFKEIFRLDMIFYKYTLAYLKRIKSLDQSPQERANNEAGVAAFVASVKEALDEQGPWAEPVE
jgi:hypothetical protein